MKKTLFGISISLICLVGNLFSQTQANLLGYYYANGSRQYWQEDHNSVNIIVNNRNHYDSITERLLRVFNDSIDEVLSDNEDNNIIIKSQSLESRNMTELLSSISLASNDITFFSYAKQINGSPIWLTNEAYVKLKDSTYYDSFVHPILSQYSDVLAYYEGDNEYRIVCQNESEVVAIANVLYDTTYVVYSTPDFYCIIQSCTNDNLFEKQWNLKNTGQNGGTTGIDIKAEKAWAFLHKEIGSTGGYVKVAVIDDGVEEHEDFYEENGVCVVLDGYTANGIGTGRPLSNHWHGECCAGIISAVHNNIGIAGVAPKSRIVPFRIYKNRKIDDFNCVSYSISKIAKTIKKAWDDFHCPILSNSWTIPSPDDELTYAINYVATQGREGKGCIVLFSSGNKEQDSVEYPSNLDKVVSVGSIDKNGNRVYYSNYGDNLEFVAPDYVIITTDRMGDAGYCNNQTLTPNYNTAFYGTSAACPHVSGVAALILSVRPELTREQVYEILESTAQKVGNYDYNNDHTYIHPNGTWNQEVGHGLVDAHMAVVEAALYGREVSLLGNDQVDLCENTTFACFIHHPDNFTFEWSCSDNLAILPNPSYLAGVMPITTGNAFIQVDVYSEGRLIRSLRKDLIITDSNHLSLEPLNLSPISVSTNTTWSNDNHLLPFDAIIESGATLTITGTVHCSYQACIIVKPGGRLILDRGKLTSLCPNSLWQGIEVWGNKNAHQFEINGNYAQGYLELKNGAVIENAKCAVELWRPNYWSSTGGIIHATDATFRNNTTAVRALCYTNFIYNTHKETSYNAYFNNCTFVVDENYSGTETFHRHVTLADVNGISFKGCDFSAKRGLQNVHQWCVGINAYDAGFTVNSLCNSTTVLPCPDDYIDKSTFTGFCSAIRASSNGSHPRSFSVRNSVFTHNDRGIHAENTGFPTILMNEFCISDNGYCDYNYGIITKNVTGFCIEENSFHPSSKTDATTVGIAIYNSNGINDVYHNTFSNLARANLAFGQNVTLPNSSTSFGTGLGLTYTCNENNGNQRDFMVLQTDGVGDIQSQQGSLSCPSGNTFMNSEIRSASTCYPQNSMVSKVAKYWICEGLPRESTFMP